LRGGNQPPGCAEAFQILPLTRMLTNELIEKLAGFVFPPAVSEQISEATDRFGIFRPELRSQAIGLFRFRRIVVRGKQIGRGHGVM